MNQTQAFKNLEEAIFEKRKTRRIKDIKQALEDYKQAKRPFYIKMLGWCIDFWKSGRFNVSLHQQKTVKKKNIKSKTKPLDICPICQAPFIADEFGACQSCGRRSY